MAQTYCSLCAVDSYANFANFEAILQYVKVSKSLEYWFPIYFYEYKIIIQGRGLPLPVNLFIICLVAHIKYDYCGLHMSSALCAFEIAVRLHKMAA